MASYHLSAQLIKRSKGRSAVAAAAYRAGSRLTDERTGEVFDYSKRRGVAHAEVLVPDHAPDWMRDRDRLWNAVEAGEKRVDAQLAREINVALPHELSDDERRELVRGFVQEQFVARGMVADMAIHTPVPEKGDDPRNHHAHIMLTLRQANRDGFHRVKTREWNKNEVMKSWREAWADHQNRSLERKGLSARVDHRTLVVQREEAKARGDRARAESLDRQPELHVGPRSFAAGRHGHRPQSKDRMAGAIRDAAGLRQGERKVSLTRHYVDEGAREGSWMKRQFAGRRTYERKETKEYGRRLVQYTVIDHGTRLEENMRRLAGNSRQMAEKLARLQQKAARFRLRRQWLGQQEHEWEKYHRALERHRAADKRRRAFERKKDEEELYRAWFRVQHVRKRRGLADALIQGIDNVIAGLLGIREHQLGRQNAQRGRGRGRGVERQVARSGDRGRRRTRATYPKGSAIF